MLITRKARNAPSPETSVGTQYYLIDFSKRPCLEFKNIWTNIYFKGVDKLNFISLVKIPSSDICNMDFLS